MNLNYFDDGTYTDFRPIAPNSGYVQGNGLSSGAKRNLYNGNIGSMGIDIRALATSAVRDAGPMLYNYGYDQLNRITKMDAWNANGNLGPVGTVALTEYAERYGYDPNGNILTLNRNGDSVHTSMDQLSYKYVYAKTGGGTGEYVPGSAPTSGVDHLTNQLSSIQDAVTGNSYSGDIKTQAAFNYQYDAIGELIDDDTAKIHTITWNVYGKLLSLSDSGNTITYTYDAAGNRISKVAHGITTWYVRDAQGNVMSVYTQGNSAIHGDSLTQTETHLYGSSRLGVLNLNVNCASSLTQPTLRSLVRGNKLFELTNHLGNVLATISDKKIQHSTDSTTVAYYTADVLNANDYYPFGMQMPVRSFTQTSAGNYRYGFNGKEQDPEVKGAGDQYDYGMRMYDPRVAKFLSVDPLTSNFAQYSPYQYAGNTPIQAIDVDGLEEYVVTKELFRSGATKNITVQYAVTSDDNKALVNEHFRAAVRKNPDGTSKLGDYLTDQHVIRITIDANGKENGEPSNALTKTEQTIVETRSVTEAGLPPTDDQWRLTIGKTVYLSETVRDATKMADMIAEKKFKGNTPIFNGTPLQPGATVSDFQGSSDYFYGVYSFPEGGQLGDNLVASLTSFADQLKNADNVTSVTLNLKQGEGFPVGSPEYNTAQRYGETALNNAVTLVQTMLKGKGISVKAGSVNTEPNKDNRDINKNKNEAPSGISAKLE